MKEEISVVLSCDDNFAQHAGVLMESVLSTAKRSHNLHFYIVDGDIFDDKKEKITSISNKYNAQITFLKVNKNEFKDLYISFQYTSTIYYRLIIGKLLPASVNRCIYLDCDMICCSDIEELWKTDLEDRILGAVLDHGMLVSGTRWNNKIKELDFDEDDIYFNSGLLLIDLKKWRSLGLDDRAMKLARNHNYTSHDQDILNVLFRKSWTVLNSRWNCMPSIYGFNKRLFSKRKKYSDIISARKDPGILHFAGRYKPWEYPERKGFSDLYYKNLKNTPFWNGFQAKRSPQNIKKSGYSELFRIYLGNILYSLFG